MKARAPSSVYWPALLGVGFELLVKIFRPSEENHDAACWLVVTAIRTRITSTSRPAARATIWKLRSPSGRRSLRGSADPAGLAGPAGSTWVIVLTTERRSDMPAPRQSSASW